MITKLNEWDGKERRSGWAEYQSLVLAELERLNNTAIELDKKLNNLLTKDILELKVEIATLKVKAGMIGAVCGAAPAILMFIVGYFRR